MLHDIQAGTLQPQAPSIKASPLSPQPFAVTFPGQKIASSPDNPFSRRPHETWSMPPSSMVQAMPESRELASEVEEPRLERKPFSLYAEGQTPPAPPNGRGIQAKLTIGQPNDHYEKEADRTTKRTIQMPESVGWGQIVPDLQASNDGASSTNSGLQRVQVATAANDLESLKTIQKDLRKQMLSDPLHPPKDVREALATARTWTMDRIAAIRDKYAPQIETAKGGNAGTDHTGAIETIEESMDKECTPYLDVLMEGDPQYRYQHFNTEVSEKVFAAVRLHSARRALDGIGQKGHRAKAEAEARLHANLPNLDDPWCGAFAYTQAEMGGGFDSKWVGAMQGERGIRGALTYYGEMNPWIWVFDDWKRLKNYHNERGSLRWYKTIEQKPPIQAGDLVLIDNDYGLDPDHITTAISFDGRFLTTVGGNQGTKSSDDETGVSRNLFDLQKNPSPNDVTNRNAQGQPIDSEGNVLDPTAPDYNRKRTHAPGKTKNKRIHGVGRWSVVDYERHLYSTSQSKPSQPSPAQLAALG